MSLPSPSELTKGKNILLLGGSGSLGHALAAAWAPDNQVLVFSRDENKQWLMKQKFPQLRYVLGDVRNPESLRRVYRRFCPDLVVHAAALKHVEVCEENIAECIATNVTGLQNSLEAAQELGKKGLDFVFISTDKACSPINVYGMSKALGERMVAEAAKKDPSRRFINVRYGNVFNSRGSVVEKFARTVERARSQPDFDPVFQVTDPRMTRFFMSLEESVRLIEFSLASAVSGEIWISKAPSFRILDLATHCASLCGGRVEITGLRGPEKLDETLLNQEEMRKARQILDFFFFDQTPGSASPEALSCFSAPKRPAETPGKEDSSPSYDSSNPGDFSLLTHALAACGLSQDSLNC